MKISVYWFWEALKNLPEPIIAIDVWAATTNLVTILSKNPKHLIIVNEENFPRAEAIYPNSFLVGESEILPSKVFDVSNYPPDIAAAWLRNKSVLFMTDNGTRVFEKYQGKQVISCAFVNLAAVAEFLRDKKQLTIIMAGDKPNKTLEDEICSQILIKEIKREKYDWEDLAEKMKKFIKSYYQWPPKEENKALPIVLRRSKYEIIPAGRLNKKGFVEIGPL